jgi:AcrR family transcriptional regulator
MYAYNYLFAESTRMSNNPGQPDESASPAKRGRPRKTGAQQAAIRQKITETASLLFRSEGYHAVSMRRIAKEMNVTPMALYSYFPSKLAILSCLWIDILDEVREEMRQAAAGLVAIIRFVLVATARLLSSGVHVGRADTG